MSSEIVEPVGSQPGKGPITPGRVMLYTASVLFVLALAWFLVTIYSILILIVIGILFATAIEPLVNRLRRRNLSRSQAIMVVYGVLLGTLAIAFVFAAPTLIHHASNFDQTIPSFFDDLHQQALDSRSGFLRTTGADAIAKARQAYIDYRENPSIDSSQALRVVTSVIGALITIISVLVIAFYWMTEKIIIKRLVLSLVPLKERDRAHTLWDNVEAKLGGWTRGQLILCAIMGISSSVIFFALGLKFWLALGIWIGITEIIPYIGPIIGGATAVLVALTQSPKEAILVLIAVLLLQQLEGHILVPRVMHGAVGLSPLTVVISVIIGERLLGPLGAVLAVPIGAVVQVLVQDLVIARFNQSDTGMTGARVRAALEGTTPPTSPPTPDPADRP